MLLSVYRLGRVKYMFRELIRKNKKLSEGDCVYILKKETRGVLSVQGDDGYPYGMPMNHLYDEESGAIYFHCGKEGHRVDSLKKCDKVSFCVYDKGERAEGQWAWVVKSVIVFGRMEMIDDLSEIEKITRKLSYKFTNDEKYIENEIKSSAHRTLLLKLVPENICGKIVTEA